MFRLGGPERPADGASLARAVADGLAKGCEPESPPPAVSAAGGDWPEVGELVVDLTGCRLGTDGFGGTAEGATEPGPVVSALAVRGRPTVIGGTEATVDVTAREAAFRFSTEGETVALVLARHAGGDVRLFVTREELERRITEVLGRKLAAQGVKVIDVTLDLTPVDGNRVDAEVAVTFRMMFKAKVRARGRLHLGDDLTLVVEETSVTGEGMTGRTFAGIARPQLQALTGKEFAFGGLLPAGIVPSDVSLQTEGGLGVTAKLEAAGA